LKLIGFCFIENKKGVRNILYYKFLNKAAIALSAERINELTVLEHSTYFKPGLEQVVAFGENVVIAPNSWGQDQKLAAIKGNRPNDLPPLITLDIQHGDSADPRVALKLTLNKKTGRLYFDIRGLRIERCGGATPPAGASIDCAFFLGQLSPAGEKKINFASKIIRLRPELQN